VTRAKPLPLRPRALYCAPCFSKSRFNPASGIADFWNEFRRPHPYRWPILALSVLPVAGMLYWGMNSTVYGEPERPKINYITTLDPTRTDAEIMAENRANQEVKDLRAGRGGAHRERKRDMYKALGAAAGMDVEEIERKAEAERAAEEAAEAKRRAGRGRPHQRKRRTIASPAPRPITTGWPPPRGWRCARGRCRAPIRAWPRWWCTKAG
jgi:hypothetical protein